MQRVAPCRIPIWFPTRSKVRLNENRPVLLSEIKTLKNIKEKNVKNNFSLLL
jgi:hypothetical protein